MKSILPIRVKPFVGQCARDYLNYLADENGWTNKLSFMAAIGLRDVDKFWAPGTDEFNKTLTTLAAWVADDKGVVESRLKPFPAILSSSHSYVGVKPNLHCHPRFCPICIQDSPWLKQEWRISKEIFCRMHGVLLIDTCPECLTTKSWHDNHRFLCRKCDFSFIANSTLGQSNPEMNFRLQRFIDENLSKLLTVIGLISRPIDLLPASVSLYRLQNTILYRLFSIAATFITSKAYRNRLTELATTELYRLVGGEEIKAFVPSLCRGSALLDFPETPSSPFGLRKPADDISWLIDISGTPFEVWVTPKRLTYKQHVTYEDLASQCDTLYLSNALRLQTTDIMKLIHCGMISPVKMMRISRDMIFDVRGVSIKLNCSPLSEVSDPISWSTIQSKRYLKLLNATLGDLMEAVASNKIVAYSESAYSPLSVASFSRQALIDYFDDALNYLQDDITCQNFAKMLGVSTPVVASLLTDGYLYSNHWQTYTERSNTELKHYSVKTFLSNYICSNRLGNLYGVRYDAVMNRIIKAGYRPEIEYPGAAFYRRNDEFDTYLATELLPTLRIAKAPKAGI